MNIVAMNDNMNDHYAWFLTKLEFKEKITDIKEKITERTCSHNPRTPGNVVKTIVQPNDDSWHELELSTRCAAAPSAADTVPRTEYTVPPTDILYPVELSNSTCTLLKSTKHPERPH